MTEDTAKIQSAAFLISQSASAIVEALGMLSENLQRQSLGQSMAYREEAFRDVIDRSKIGWNDAISALHG